MGWFGYRFDQTKVSQPIVKAPPSMLDLSRAYKFEFLPSAISIKELNSCENLLMIDWISAQKSVISL